MRLVMLLAAFLGLAVPQAAAGATLAERRKAQEEVVRKVGPEALRFTQEYGDEAIGALMACSPETGRRLATAPRVCWLPEPKKALLLMARHGDELALWVLARLELLSDEWMPGVYELFLAEPMEYVSGLKDLRTEWLVRHRAEVARKEEQARQAQARALQGGLLAAAALAAGACGLGFWAWTRHRGWAVRWLRRLGVVGGGAA